VLIVAIFACIDRPVSPEPDSFPIERIGCLHCPWSPLLGYDERTFGNAGTVSASRGDAPCPEW
jgi:hypothetical protein